MTSYVVSPEGLAFLAAQEGFYGEPKQMPDGNWLVGHGHVRVGEPGAAVSEDDARELLRLDAAPYERLVNEAVVGPLTQGQFDALVSFALSIGAEAFTKSAVLRRLNSGEFVAAACAMEAWRKSDIAGEEQVLEALVRRRAAEKALFLGGGEAAPSAFVRAKLDHAAAILGAPIAFAQAPAVGEIAVVAEKAADAQIIVDVLKSEPATEALLLTQALPAEEAEPIEEITTAHAKPVARTVQQGRQAMRRAAEEARAAYAQRRSQGVGRVVSTLLAMFRAPARA